MMTSDLPEPKFDRPPVAEVTISVQFEPLLGLSTIHIGRLWSEWIDEYPHTEEHDELAPLPDEALAGQLPPSFRFSVANRPLPRTWFLDPAGEHVIQVQRDRLVLNWRRQGGAYPHYSLLLTKFRSVYEQFASFVAQQEIGPLVPNQCHVTYLNLIPLSGEASCPSGLSGLLVGWSDDCTDPSSLAGQEVTIQMRYPIITKPAELVGRLYVGASYAVNSTTDERVLLLEMTARGRPLTLSLDGVVTFLDLGHHAIVTTFAAITTPEMHTVWGKQP